MELNDFIKSVKIQQKRFMLIVASIFLVSFVYTIVQPLKFGATSQLLIVQNATSQADAYSISKSNEYLSTTLASVITTNSFYNEVMNAGFNVDENYFGTDARTRKKTWEKTVEAKNMVESGVLEVSVYHPDRYQLDQLSQAVNLVLRTKHAMYHGGGNSVYVRVINDPIISVWPVKPNIIVNLLGGLVVGTLVGLFYVYIFPIKTEEVVAKINFIKPSVDNTPKPKNEFQSPRPQTNNTYRSVEPNRPKFEPRETPKPIEIKPVETPKVEIAHENIKTIDPIKPEDIIKHGDINNVF